MSFTIFQSEKTSFQALKKRSSKSREITHGFNPKMAIFLTFLFQAIQARKMSFTIFYNEKAPFQAIKTTSLKRREIDIFPAPVNPCFWSKNGRFSNFFVLGNIGQENVFYDILEGKNVFLSYKNKKSKKSKKSNWFWSKNGHFSNFFLGNIGQENVFYDILEPKNVFLSYKNKKSKKSKN